MINLYGQRSEKKMAGVFRKEDSGSFQSSRLIKINLSIFVQFCELFFLELR